MDDALAVGVVGCGRFGTVLADLAPRAGLRVAAVYDQAGNANGLAARTGAVAPGTLHGLLAVDGLAAVLVATSHESHRSVTEEALAAGKHVFCEKPMALSVRDCVAMRAAAARSGCTLLVGHVQRLEAPVRAAEAVLRGGELGEPVLATVVRCADLPRRNWWTAAAASGGAVFSPGIHELDLLNSWLGDPVSAQATPAPSIQRGLDYPDSLTATVTYSSGAIASIVLSLSDGLPAPAGTHWIRVLGTTGTLALDMGGAPSVAWQARNAGTPGPMRVKHVPYDTADAVVDELANFAAVVRGEAPPFTSAEAATLAVAVGQAINRSLALGRKVDISEVTAAA